MNPSATDSGYVAAVLALYLEMPETPLRTNSQDQRCARQLQDRGVSLGVVESAFLLASLRRLLRPADTPQLPPVRSLAYFLPVIAELLSNPAPESYLSYLRLKLRRIASGKITGTSNRSADVQKNTFSDDR